MIPSSVQRQVLQESKGDGTDFPGLLHFGLCSFKLKIENFKYYIIMDYIKILNFIYIIPLLSHSTAATYLRRRL